MHHPDTHTHAHIHTHQKQWAVKRCPYPPQKASTNQIRPDQNMPFKVRAGVEVGGGAFGEAQPTHWPWEQLAWPEKERGDVKGGQGGIKKWGNANVPPPLGLEIRVLWGPTQHQAPVLPTSSFTLGLFTQDTVTPPPPLTFLQHEPRVQGSPWESQGLISVSSSLYPACHIWFCGSLSVERSVM